MNNYSSGSAPGAWQWPEELDTQSEIRQRQPMVEDHDEEDDEQWEEIPRPTSTAAPEPKAERPQQEPIPTQKREDHSNTPPPPPPPPKPTPRSKKQRHYKPRQCRICLETVNPTFTFDNQTPDLPTNTTTSFIPTSVLNSLPQVFTKPRVTYTSEDGGRLLRPCKCKGTQQYVHEGCLQSWRHADPAYGRRHYWQCPTCAYKYRLQRLGWSRWISNAFTQVGLTVVILLATTFVLGFIADPIINFCMDPYGSVWYGTWSIWSSGPSVEEEYFNDYYAEHDGNDDSWIEHFTKGFASLGMAVWKGVRAWSRRVLERASERVLDVQGVDNGDEDDDDEDEEVTEEYVKEDIIRGRREGEDVHDPPVDDHNDGAN